MMLPVSQVRLEAMVGDIQRNQWLLSHVLLWNVDQPFNLRNAEVFLIAASESVTQPRVRPDFLLSASLSIHATLSFHEFSPKYV